MDKHKNYPLAVAGLLFVGFALSLTNAGNVVAQAAKDVAVGNTLAQPLPMTLKDAPSAFVASADCQFGGDDVCKISPLYTVPRGKTAVIESASGVCVTNSGTATREFQLRFTGPQGTAAQLSLPPSPAVAAAGASTGFVNINVSAFAQNLKSYASGGASGTAVEFFGFASANQTPGFPNCVFTVSGRLIPSARTHGHW